MEQKRPAHHYVEPTELSLGQAVDAHWMSLDSRPECRRGDAEAESLLGPGQFRELRRAARSPARRPIPLTMIVKVDGDDFGRATALQLEREEPVVRADVETSLATHVGPRQLFDDRPQVEPTRCRHSGRELERVVP